MLELKSISKKFNSEIFKDFSYIFNNDIYFLRGNNGSGKSTLLKLIKGIYLCDDGDIIFDNQFNQKNDISYIDGNFRTFFHRLTVRHNLEYFFSLQNKNETRNSIDELLNFFKISHLQNKLFSSLSQGQMQLVSIVRGLSIGPKIILLDEVFSSLDSQNKRNVLEYLSDFILKDKTIVIFTSHEEEFNEIKFTELCLK